ncbi:DUF3887 domain-containing protein [Chryseobacterium fluminis]|uniref:DUF3887 domain-containing protein n=1 Tax=Chryseobacterium fluminis TaxID=2983606 RepID=UPI002252D921|nr:DUF3887 domain-containing protein [Chryseobacterium sp. MMS21-Ot14]UZT99072.1 DUF3887 domain-containing protein [Chryseobacterium sp. MMS21-Ot14]
MNFFLKIFFTFTPFLLFSQSKKEIGSIFIESLFINRNIDKSYDLFDSSITNELPINELRATEQQIKEQLGSFKRVIEINKENNIYYYYSEFEKSKLDIQISFNEDNKIIGLFFIPHKIFENTNADNNSLNIKSNDIELKGTFLEPLQNNQKKLVIFFHGSGPQDRDETIGENKPLKDIAEYLFSSGIASYRFDKRTLTNPETFDNNSTVEEEVINDAVNVINYFNENYKDYEIILIGHSLGGYLLPKIFKKNNNISKLIFLAANARPVQEVIVDQFIYINKINPSSVSNESVESIKKQVNYLNSKKFNSNSDNSALPFNLSAKYWEYLINYNPLTLLKSINIPMLFLQGGKTIR